MTDLTALSDADLNRRVAEVLGHEIVEFRARTAPVTRHLAADQHGELWWCEAGRFDRIWSPANRIEDAWELEESVPEEGRKHYGIYLLKIVDPENSWTFNNWGICHASPRQRTEAWVRWMEQSCG